MESLVNLTSRQVLKKRELNKECNNQQLFDYIREIAPIGYDWDYEELAAAAVISGNTY